MPIDRHGAAARLLAHAEPPRLAPSVPTPRFGLAVGSRGAAVRRGVVVHRSAAADGRLRLVLPSEYRQRLRYGVYRMPAQPVGPRAALARLAAPPRVSPGPPPPPPRDTGICVARDELAVGGGRREWRPPYTKQLARADRNGSGEQQRRDGWSRRGVCRSRRRIGPGSRFASWRIAVVPISRRGEP